MITRAQKGISKSKQFPNYVSHLSVKHSISPSNRSLLTTVVEPKTFKSAIKDHKWQVSMKDEYTSFRNNGTWVYMAPAPHMNTLGPKWVYKVKKKADGTIDRFKSRLVAKVYDQQDGIDCNETFSHVVKCTTVRVVLCMALTYNWHVRQLH
ncbi:uncharacterized protein LOC113312614 [Papaver somniferum]|uniref:uncharacterized protein LOC113312614 n=1 Tax=Papaver somniferum TaxID=3469 RepID=UPI000E7011D1|nr:uncharacterized protein LOC113312614 [Papaver somniferum]